MKRLSVITVVWNAAQDLERTLNNVVSFGRTDIEMVVIDGGSTDGSEEIARRFEPDYMVSEADKGLYDAMNKGLMAATGEYVWFINAGDLIHSLPRIDGSADIYYGETLITDTEGKALGLRRKQLPDKLTWKSLKRGMVVCHQSFIVRRSLAPLYDLKYRYVADIEWVIECLQRAKSVQNTGLILSEFAEGGISTRNRKASLRERWSVMVERYGIIQTAWAHLRFIAEQVSRQKYRPMKKVRE